MSCPICKSSAYDFYFAKDAYKIHKCRQCTGLFVRPMPSADELAQFYEDYYKTSQYSAKLESKIRRASRRIKKLRKAGVQRFLDVGCNVGFATEAARRLGFEAFGIDLDPVAIKTAHELFPHARFSTDDLDELAQKQEIFDLIYCSEVIEHLLDPGAFLRSIRKVMRSGSTVYLTTPDAGHYTIPQKPDRFCKWSNVRPPEHLLYFNGRAIRNILHDNGFKAISIAFNFKPTLKVQATI